MDKQRIVKIILWGLFYVFLALSASGIISLGILFGIVDKIDLNNIPPKVIILIWAIRLSIPSTILALILILTIKKRYNE